MNNLKLLINSTSATKSSIVHEYSGSSPYHTSIDIKTTGIYNLCEGVVCQIGNEPENLYYICVKLSDACVLKYGHLETIYFDLNGRIRPGELLGVAKNYATFEYLTLSESRFPIYVNDIKLYKQDPSPIILEDKLPSINSSQSTYKHTSDPKDILLGLDTTL